MGPRSNYLMSINTNFLNLKNKYNSTYLLGLLWKANELMHITFLSQCLARASTDRCVCGLIITIVIVLRERDGDWPSGLYYTISITKLEACRNVFLDHFLPTFRLCYSSPIHDALMEHPYRILEYGWFWPIKSHAFGFYSFSLCKYSFLIFLGEDK